MTRLTSKLQCMLLFGSFIMHMTDYMLRLYYILKIVINRICIYFFKSYVISPLDIGSSKKYLSLASLNMYVQA